MSKLLKGMMAVLVLLLSIFYTWMPFVSITYVLNDTDTDHKKRRDHALKWGSIIAGSVIIVLIILAMLMGGAKLKNVTSLLS